MPAYTIGTETEYDDAMIRGVGGNGVLPVVKRGKYTQPDGTEYYGGYAFETVAHAYAFIDKIGKTGMWAAYEMDCAWPDDVWHGHPGDEHMVLKRDAILVRKVPRPGTEPSAAAASTPPGGGLAARLRALLGRWFG